MILSIVGAAISLCAVLVALLGRFVFWRDARPRRAVVAEYAPPEGMTIPIAAELLGRTKVAFAAGLVDLAVRRKLQIVPRPSGKGFGVRQLAEEDPGDQERVLNSLFGATELDGGPGGVRWLDRRDPLLHDEVIALSSVAINKVRYDGLRITRPNAGILAVGAVPVAGVVVAFMGLTRDPALTPLVVLVFAVLATVVSFRLIGVDGGLTPEGAEALASLHGLRLYLDLTESDRLAMLNRMRGADAHGDGVTSVIDVEESLLPYAVLFGLEKRWASVLGRYYAADPGWYAGRGAFTPEGFGTEVGDFASEVATTYPGRGRRTG